MQKYEVISRKEAIEQGLEHYYTGVPCKRGHLSLRPARSKECLACKPIRAAEYEARPTTVVHRRQYHRENSHKRNLARKALRKANQEREQAYEEANRWRRRKWRQENKESERRRLREYWRKNRDLLLERAKAKRIALYGERQPTPRMIAKKEGKIAYLSPFPCSSGHTSKRYTSNNSCIECERIRHKQQRQRYNEKHAEEIAARRVRAQERREAALEKAREYARYYRGTLYGRERRKEYDRKREKMRLQRTPPWLSREQRRDIRNIYNERKRISLETGVEHHVDHIFPLIGKRVSGLHVPWNLQILRADINIRKGNKLVESGVKSEEDGRSKV